MRKIIGSDIVRPIARNIGMVRWNSSRRLAEAGQVTSTWEEKIVPNGESKEMLTFEKSVFASKEQ